jgi:hypothetical protein
MGFIVYSLLSVDVVDEGPLPWHAAALAWHRTTQEYAGAPSLASYVHTG